MSEERNGGAARIWNEESELDKGLRPAAAYPRKVTHTSEDAEVTRRKKSKVRNKNRNENVQRKCQKKDKNYEMVKTAEPAVCFIKANPKD